MASLDGNLRSVRRRVVWSVAAAAAWLCTGPVHAQVIDQRLDSIVVHGATQAQGVVQTPMLDKVLYSAEAEAPFTPHPLQGTHDLKACQGTGTRGLYCLDYDASTNVYAVLRWKNPDRDPAAVEEIRCSQLGLAQPTARLGLLHDRAQQKQLRSLQPRFAAQRGNARPAYAADAQELRKQIDQVSGSWARFHQRSGSIALSNVASNRPAFLNPSGSLTASATTLSSRNGIR